MCQWSAGVVPEPSRGGTVVPAARLTWRWCRLWATPAMPRATMSAMLMYQSHGVRPRAVRPPPVLAARDTFFIEEALPMPGEDLTGYGSGFVVGGRRASGPAPRGQCAAPCPRP